jgi:hypothetical protein
MSKGRSEEKPAKAVNRTLAELFKMYGEAIITGTEDSALRIRRLIRDEADKVDRK